MQKILLADDDRSFRRSLTIALTTAGHEVYEAEDGMRALRLLKKERFKAVITNMRMPELDGLSLAKQISQSYPDTKVVLISAYEFPKAAAAYAHLSKPFAIEELLKILGA